MIQVDWQPLAVNGTDRKVAAWASTQEAKRYDELKSTILNGSRKQKSIPARFLNVPVTVKRVSFLNGSCGLLGFGRWHLPWKVSTSPVTSVGCHRS
eukprot:5248927-Amphidinium_carterae.1